MQFAKERIRILFDVEEVDPQASVDSVTGASAAFWRDNDIQFELGFRYGEDILDMSNFTEIKLTVKENDNRRGPALMKKAVGADVIVFPVFTQEEWDSSAKQHCIIPFDAVETRLDMRGLNERTLFLSARGLTTAGKRLNLGSHMVTIHDDGEEGADNSPPVGSSVIAPGTTYSGAGLLVVNGLTANKYYSYTKGGANDTKLVNGTEELLVSGNFITQGTTVTLHGAANQLVTAAVRTPVFATLDELRAIFQPKGTPFMASPNGRYIRLLAPTDEGLKVDKIVDTQNLP